MRDIDGRNAAARESLVRLAKSESLSLEVLELDVTHDASVEAAVGRLFAHTDILDVVINNAGVAGIGVTEAFTPEQFQQIFDVNVLGIVRVNRAVLPRMRRQGHGLLVHLSSGAGRVTIPAMAAYCASKFAVEALADAYRFELLPFGIDSVVVEPGIYRTPIFDRLVYPGDQRRLADYGTDAEYADRVHGVFKAAISAPDAPGSAEVTTALLRLIDMQSGERPFRTVVSAPIQQLLEPYNAAAESLRPVVAQIFNVPELAGPRFTASKVS